MHSIDLLLVIPECFQIVLINILLLFAICFSYYSTQNLTRDKLSQSAYDPFEPYASPKLSSNTEHLNTNSYKKKTLEQAVYSNPNQLDQSIQQSLSPVYSQNHTKFSPRLVRTQTQITRPSYSYISTPVTLIEPIIQLVILSLICCSILYVNSPLTYAVGLTDSIIWDSLHACSNAL